MFRRRAGTDARSAGRRSRMREGGDDSWGARTHEEYLLPNDRALQFAFVFKGI
ncbi:hypothetical protein GCWU000341_01065 [Oribacterium sp. oral taxon 078 str. F0262]|nr:hypothetical protein GCWU000341_01065 [Oribacterium sp. oral taxon 078 str. F0262]